MLQWIDFEENKHIIDTLADSGSSDSEYGAVEAELLAARAELSKVIEAPHQRNERRFSSSLQSRSLDDANRIQPGFSTHGPLRNVFNSAIQRRPMRATSFFWPRITARDRM